MTAKKKVPEFTNLEEERSFWDTTNIDALAEGELAPTQITVAETPTVTISVRMSRADVKRLRALAAHRDQGATTMARSWILERLTTEETSGDDPRAVLQRLRSDVEHLASTLGGR